MPSLDGAVVLVTGANGGIGTHFVHDALARGASQVYATARTRYLFRSPFLLQDERVCWPVGPGMIAAPSRS